MNRWIVVFIGILLVGGTWLWWTRPAAAPVAGTTAGAKQQMPAAFGLGPVLEVIARMQHLVVVQELHVAGQELGLQVQLRVVRQLVEVAEVFAAAAMARLSVGVGFDDQFIAPANQFAFHVAAQRNVGGAEP